jgi:hypothetical protein
MQVIQSFSIKDPSGNETAAYNKFKFYKDGINRIIFKSGTKQIVLDNVTKIDFVGGANKKNEKADFKIIYGGNKKFNISLKLPKFDSWESADTLIGDVVAEKILVYLLEDVDSIDTKREFVVQAIKDSSLNNKVRYSIVRKNTNIIVNIAYKCSTQDTNYVVFGSDILGMGAIIGHNFVNDSSIPDANGTLTLNVDSIIQNENEISDDYYPHFQVTSRKEIRNMYRFPGLRVQAKPKKELGSSIILPPLR